MLPYLAAPHLGLSAHKLGSLQSVLLMALGLVWPRLNLGAVTSRIAFWPFDLFDLRHLGRLSDWCCLGSRQRDHATGRRGRSWERLSGGCDQRRGLLVCADGPYFLRTYSLGASHRYPTVTGLIAGAPYGRNCELVLGRLLGSDPHVGGVAIDLKSFGTELARQRRVKARANIR